MICINLCVYVNVNGIIFYFSFWSGYFYGDFKKFDVYLICLLVCDYFDEDYVVYGYGDGWKMVGRDGLGWSDVIIFGFRMEVSRYVYGLE